VISDLQLFDSEFPKFPSRFLGISAQVPHFTMNLPQFYDITISLRHDKERLLYSEDPINGARLVLAIWCLLVRNLSLRGAPILVSSTKSTPEWWLYNTKACRFCTVSSAFHHSYLNSVGSAKVGSPVAQATMRSYIGGSKPLHWFTILHPSFKCLATGAPA
jgi:hypothetical protein